MGWRHGHGGRLNVVGNADDQGVVTLWIFMLGALNDGALGDGGGGGGGSLRGGIALARKYSMYTVRRAREAYYNRLRLGGPRGRGCCCCCPMMGAAGG